MKDGELNSSRGNDRTLLAHTPRNCGSPHPKEFSSIPTKEKRKRSRAQHFTILVHPSLMCLYIASGYRKASWLPVLSRRCIRHSLFRSSWKSRRRFLYAATRGPQPVEILAALEAEWKTLTKSERLRVEQKLVDSVRNEIWAAPIGSMFGGPNFISLVRRSLANWASRLQIDRRGQNESQKEQPEEKLAQGEKDSTPIYATIFSAEDIENEQRRPKKKAAVLIGYSGTGYHGMQMCAWSLSISW